MSSNSKSSKKPPEMTSSESATSTIASSSSSAGTSGGESTSTAGAVGAATQSGGGSGGFMVPLTYDSLTFDARQAARLKEMEKRVDDELRKRRRDWSRDVAHMREEILRLHPTAPSDGGSGGGGSSMPVEPFVARRRGSTDVLDARKMRTLFLEYPDGGRRCKLRFDVAGFEAEDISVTTDGDRIIVRGSKPATAVVHDETGSAGDADSSSAAAASKSSANGTRPQTEEFVRKIEKPKEVDHTKLKSTLTTDGILVVEAPMPPATLNLRKAAHSPSPRSTANQNGAGGGGGGSLPQSKSSSRAASPGAASGSAAAGSHVMSTSMTFPRELYGVPVIREVDGRRRLSLVIDLGTTFGAKEVTVLIIKESRLQIKARHEERTSERLSRNKFSKDFELPERIETHTLRGGLTADGKLMIGALIRGQAAGLSKSAAGELVVDELVARADHEPCNVLDLSTFPPTTPGKNINSAG
jgi:HSP20 family molecular chaperone IbpA